LIRGEITFLIDSRKKTSHIHPTSSQFSHPFSFY
jgi:hypothetical protein